jgi:hypothetical protein
MKTVYRCCYLVKLGDPNESINPAHNGATISLGLKQMSDEWLVSAAKDGDAAKFCGRHIESPETGKMRRMLSRTPFCRPLSI